MDLLFSAAAGAALDMVPEPAAPQPRANALPAPADSVRIFEPDAGQPLSSQDGALDPKERWALLMTDEVLPEEDPTLGQDMTRKFERLVTSGKHRVNDDIVRTILLRPAAMGAVLQTQWQTLRHTIVKRYVSLALPALKRDGRKWRPSLSRPQRLYR